MGEGERPVNVQCPHRVPCRRSVTVRSGALPVNDRRHLAENGRVFFHLFMVFKKSNAPLDKLYCGCFILTKLTKNILLIFRCVSKKEKSKLTKVKVALLFFEVIFS